LATNATNTSPDPTSLLANVTSIAPLSRLLQKTKMGNILDLDDYTIHKILTYVARPGWFQLTLVNKRISAIAQSRIALQLNFARAKRPGALWQLLNSSPRFATKVHRISKCCPTREVLDAQTWDKLANLTNLHIDLSKINHLTSADMIDLMFVGRVTFLTARGAQSSQTLHPLLDHSIEKHRDRRTSTVENLTLSGLCIDESTFCDLLTWPRMLKTLTCDLPCPLPDMRYVHPQYLEFDTQYWICVPVTE
jgi:hypothetical protein